MKNAKNVIIFMVCLAVSLLLPKIPYGYYLSYVGIVAAAALLGPNMGLLTGLLVGLVNGMGITNGFLAELGIEGINAIRILNSLVPYTAVGFAAGACCKRGLNEKSLIKCLVGVFAAAILGSLVGMFAGFVLIEARGAGRMIMTRLTMPAFWTGNAVNSVVATVIAYIIVKALPKDFTDNTKKNDGIEDIDYMKL